VSSQRELLTYTCPNTLVSVRENYSLGAVHEVAEFFVRTTVLFVVLVSSNVKNLLQKRSVTSRGFGFTQSVSNRNNLTEK